MMKGKKERARSKKKRDDGTFAKFEPTGEQRAHVELLSGLGLKIPEVAIVTGIPERTIYRHFPEELKRGLLKADAQVMGNLFRIATGQTPQAAPAAIFWAKARRRWHEIQRVIHGFDPTIVATFVKQVVSILRRDLPEACPHCKTRLDLPKKVAGHLRDLSEKLMKTLPASEIVAIPPEDQ